MGRRGDIPRRECLRLFGAVDLPKGRDLLDHGRLFDFLMGKRVPFRLRRAAENWERRPVRVNLRWAWTPHLHLAASVDEKIAPYLEDPCSGEVPPAEDDPAWAAVPTWAGIYRIEKLGV